MMDFTMEELECIKTLVEDDISRSSWDAVEEELLSDVEYMNHLLQRAKVLAKLKDLYND